MLSAYNTSPRGRQKSKEVSNRFHRCELCGERVRSYIGLYNHRRGKHGFNHKVVAIEASCDELPLFCAVAGTPDNLALSVGVFARACLSSD